MSALKKSAKSLFDITTNQKHTARPSTEIVRSLIEVNTHFVRRPETTYNSSQAVALS